MSTDAMARRGEEIGRASVLPALAREEELGDLDRVERRTLDEVVAREEEHEAVARRAVETDAPDEHLFGLRGRARRRDVDDAHRRRAREELHRLLGRERLLELHPDPPRVADEDRH